jgi:hypothetical protein
MVWKGTNGNNFWVGRNGEKPVAIVDHCMSKGADRRPRHPGQVAGRTLAILEVRSFGTFWNWQRRHGLAICESFQDTAWANGVLEEPDLSLPWLAECGQKEGQPEPADNINRA